MGGVIKHERANDCVVYWLYDETCSVPENDGYVGITYRLTYRLKQHRSSQKFNPNFSAMVLFSGTRDECLESERGYRPNPSVGWNNASGGGAGRIASVATRAKLSRFFKIVPRTKKWRMAISKANKGKAGPVGFRHTEEVKIRIRESALGNKKGLGYRHTPQAKAIMSAAALGNKRGRANKGMAGRVWTDVERDKVSKSLTGRSRPETVKNSIRQGHLMRRSTLHNAALSFGA